MGSDGQLRIVEVADVGEDALLVCTTRSAKTRPQLALARLSHDDHSATPFGVFRDVQRGDYGQMSRPRGWRPPRRREGPGDLSALLRSNGTWHVGG